MRRLIVVFVLAATAIMAVIAFVGRDGVSSGTGKAATDVEVVSNIGGRPIRSTPDKLVCTPADESANFRLYSLGTEFEGMALTAVFRVCGDPAPVPGDNPKLPATYRLNSVSYVYGSCEPPASEGGCAPPLEISVSPACETNVSLYEHRPRITRRRGVPSATMDRQIELYTADSTVTILSGDADLRRRAAQGLRAIRRGDPPARLPPRLMRAKRLPSPLHGAMNGSLRCDRASTAPAR